MSDIIVRLRKAADTSSPVPDTWVELLNDAIEEIERLRHWINAPVVKSKSFREIKQEIKNGV